MAQRSPLQGGRALIVEDEIFFALNLEADMHALGFDICDLAPNGQQASQLAMNNQPDVVLMDINLEGGREGIEVARWLRTVCDAPVIFISGYADRETVGASALLSRSGSDSPHHSVERLPKMREAVEATVGPSRWVPRALYDKRSPILMAEHLPRSRRPDIMPSTRAAL